MTPEALVRFVNRHDDMGAIDNGDGTLKVVGPVVHPDGRPGYESETIPATLQSVRDWLGY